jgi:hypothetical protein
MAESVEGVACCILLSAANERGDPQAGPQARATTRPRDARGAGFSDGVFACRRVIDFFIKSKNIPGEFL